MKGEACRGLSRDTLSFCICLVITQNINVHLHLVVMKGVFTWLIKIVLQAVVQ